MSIYAPYTYLVGWSQLNKFYYGVRFAKNCTPLDLFTTYFTSSSIVKQYILDYGNPDIIQIRRTFKCAEDARKWETKVLTRMQAHKHPKFLNQTNNRAIFLTEEMKKKAKDTLYRNGQHPLKGIPKTQSAKEKISKKAKQRMAKQETRDHLSKIISQLQLGTTRPESFCNKMSNKVWINDGINHARIDSSENIPDGWTKGRINLKRSYTHKWKSDRKARRSYSGEGNPSAKSIMVNGTKFNTIKDAEISLGLSAPTIRKRCRSNLPEFNDWFYL